jgi:predicted site-specific integrase-resolvase
VTIITFGGFKLEKQYWNKKDVSRVTGLSIATLNRWIQEKKNISFIKAGGRILYDPQDVTAFMETNKVKLENRVI